MADGDNRPPNRAVKGNGVPEFTAEDIKRRIGDQVSGGSSNGSYGTVYVLEGFPELSVKEIKLSDQTETTIRAIKLELHTISKLSHQNIIKYYQVVEDDDFMYIIMNRYRWSLDRFINKCVRDRKSIPAEMFNSILYQLASGLDYLHSFCRKDGNGEVYQGVVHRDIKPMNILISEDEKHIVLADFGLCKNALLSGNTFAGTKPYMAPETLIHNKTSVASDIWSLGITIYELATLRRPNFLKDKKPEDVYVAGWKPDLSAIEDAFTRGILEKILVLNLDERLTAKDLINLLRSSNMHIGELECLVARLVGTCGSLETALNDTNTKISFLEQDLRSKSDRVDSLGRQYESLRKRIDELTSIIATHKNQSVMDSNKTSAAFDNKHLGQSSAHNTGTAQ